MCEFHNLTPNQALAEDITLLRDLQAWKAGVEQAKQDAQKKKKGRGK